MNHVHHEPLHRTISVYNKICNIYSQTFNHPAEHIDEFLNHVPSNGKVLDVGCGPGVDADYMFSRGFRVTGLDYSREMVNMAGRRNSSLVVICGDMRKVDFAWETFDGIFASYSLIHIPRKDILTTLQRFHQFLKPGGIFYCSLQAGDSEEVMVPTPLRKGEHLFLNVVSTDEAKHLVQSAGFEIVEEFERHPIAGKELNFTKFALIAKKTALVAH